MPIRCPHCSTPPPFDPFVCTSCGSHLSTYLDEPLGPGTGLTAEALQAGTGGGVSAPPVGAGRPVGGTPVGGMRPPLGQPPTPPRPDNTGPFIVKVLFGLFVAMILLVQEPVGGLLFLGLLAIAVWRRPRTPIFPFSMAVVALAAVVWIAVEVIDELDAPRLFRPTPTPLPTPTSTVVGAATATLPPAARTATATVVLGNTRERVARGRARWLRGDYAGAQTELVQALTLLQTSHEALNLRALVRISAGDYPGADADSERAVMGDPSNAAYRDTRGYALVLVGKYREALEAYDRALTNQHGTGRTASLLGRGLAQTALGMLPDARTALEEGLRLLPYTDPDPQLADLEVRARRALDPLAPRPGSPSPVASPGASPPVVSTPSPVASPVALRVTVGPAVGQRERAP